MPGSGLALAFGMLKQRGTTACTGTCAPLQCGDSQQLLWPQRQAYPQDMLMLWCVAPRSCDAHLAADLRRMHNQEL